VKFAGAIWRPISTNYSGPMGNIIGLCLHVQEGNGSLYGWFNNPAAQVSSHLWAGKDGALEQYLDPPSQKAWAQAAGNPDYVSIETEGFVNEPLTDAQMLAVASVLSQAATAYSVPVTGPVAHGQPGFTQHCNPDGTPDPAWGNHSCPGPIRLAQMTSILALAHGSPVPPTPTPAPPAPPVPAPGGLVTVNVRQLQQGMTGGDVRSVQSMLNTKAGAGLATDGDFGPLTRNAVVGWQQGHGLAADGIVGANTWPSITNA
jgi:hypothetical protein